jgi:hypothetical protein
MTAMITPDQVAQGRTTSVRQSRENVALSEAMRYRLTDEQIGRGFRELAERTVRCLE